MIKVFVFISIIVSFCPIYSNTQSVLTAKSSGELITHSDYVLSYSEEHEQAFWVAYTVSKEEILVGTDRTDDYREDSLVSTGSAQLTDYKYSGYDRGHLAPAGDMKENQLEMSESFYLSNMSPQLATFNRGGWNKLENLVRDWVFDYDSVSVITGGVLKQGLPTIGDNGVSIPESYYKAVYIPSESRMMAFIMPHQKIEEELENYYVSVDSIESLTGMDLFQELEPSLQEELEKTIGGVYDATSIISKSSTSRESDLLLSVAPNPISILENDVTFILSTSCKGDADFSIYDVVGNRVEYQQRESIGDGKFVWNLKNQFGKKVSVGSYLAIIKVVNNGLATVCKTMVGVRY